MAATLAHRGPDDSGVWVDADAGLAFGFRRLSIIDLSPSGHQPMVSEDGRFVIVFNGEIYNFRDLRAELEEKGRRFSSASDTEVILAGAAEWGLDKVVERLWGMFAIAVWDRRERVLLLARDRLGKKPLYYARQRDTFFFASELKALRANPAFSAAIDPSAVASYLRHAYVPTPASIYYGVAKLSPGSLALVRRGGDISVHRYWHPETFLGEKAFDAVPNASEVVLETERLLQDAVERRMVADVPLGAMLSGGVDSSTVVALMQRKSSRPVKTFTIGFEQHEYDEAAAAREVARHLRTEHYELFVTPEETRATIPRLPDLYDEPFADISQVPTFILSTLTRRHVTVAVSGDGGDEVFGGYNRYGWASPAWRAISPVPAILRRTIGQRVLAVHPDRWDRAYNAVEWALPQRAHLRFPGEKLHKFAELAGAADGRAFYDGLVSIWKCPRTIMPPDVVESDPNRDAKSLFGAKPATLTEYMMGADLLTYLPDDVLVKVDRASMGASLEVRAPLLDHRIVERVSALPLSFKQRRGTSKWLLRQVLYRHVPPALVERPKMGFGVPVGDWLRGPLREWTEDLLSERELRASGVLEAAPIRQTWEQHLRGRRNHDHRLWAVLMFQAWRHRWHM